MELGTENRNKTIIAVVVGVLALVSLGRTVFSSPSPKPPGAVASQSAGQSATSTPALTSLARETRTGQKTIARKTEVTNPLDPRLQLALLQASESTAYSGSGRNIFLSQAPPPDIPLVKQTPVNPGPPVPAGPPPPPPITLKFYGFASRAGEPKKVFLSQGEDIFIAAEGDIVNRRYRVVHIGPASVEIEDVLYNNRQNIPLSQS